MTVLQRQAHAHAPSALPFTPATVALKQAGSGLPMSLHSTPDAVIL